MLDPSLKKKSVNLQIINAVDLGLVKANVSMLKDNFILSYSIMV